MFSGCLLRCLSLLPFPWLQRTAALHLAVLYIYIYMARVTNRDNKRFGLANYYSKI